ncbi:hypothetical protein [Pleionea sp. CnH1-48]|uniref:hypothetical protein n=1 Tax=Pleionea sp. CnH1-48 TaxID=2954494 RepID=UPI0020968292|nr:hypothetical protein [Pleionea sp. CnH1-48]MCO7223028.1 hypothetical protein [Pleionea sp. CnH1-48]
MKHVYYKEHKFSCKTKEEKININLRAVKYVTKVYSGSPAEAFGLQPGDFLGTVNGVAAIDVDLSSIYDAKTNNHYFVHRASESRSFYIEGCHLPLGIEAENTTKNIVKSFEEGEFDDSELYQLWERKDWKSLLKASVHASNQENWFSRIFAKLLKLEVPGIAILTHGIALYELGEKSKGLELIENYRDEHIDGWTTNWHALTFYYLGLAERENGNMEEAHKLLYTSEYYCRCDVLHAMLLTFGIEESDKEPWTGEFFPIDFHLDNFEGTKEYQLSKIIDGLEPNKLLYLCVMPSYRGNGPYNDRVATYEKLIDNFSDLTSPLYVISDKKEASETMPGWYIENEKKLLAEGKPLIQLYDEDRQVADVLDQSTSPNIYILNKQGKIIDSGLGFYYQNIWTLLEKEIGSVLTIEESSE